MDKDERKMLRKRLRREGFDTCRSSREGWVKVGCSQCQATFICGVPCHETGCPNARPDKRRKRQL